MDGRERERGRHNEKSNEKSRTSTPSIRMDFIIASSYDKKKMASSVLSTSFYKNMLETPGLVARRTKLSYSYRIICTALGASLRAYFEAQVLIANALDNIELGPKSEELGRLRMRNKLLRVFTSPWSIKSTADICWCLLYSIAFVIHLYSKWEEVHLKMPEQPDTRCHRTVDHCHHRR